MDNPEKMAT